MATNASAVSRVLRQAGYYPTTSLAREGVRVRWHRNGASVTCDWDSEETSLAEAAEMSRVLQAQGFTVERSPNNAAILYVSREG